MAAQIQLVHLYNKEVHGLWVETSRVDKKIFLRNVNDGSILVLDISEIDPTRMLQKVYLSNSCNSSSVEVHLNYKGMGARSLPGGSYVYRIFLSEAIRDPAQWRRILYSKRKKLMIEVSNPPIWERKY